VASVRGLTSHLTGHYRDDIGTMVVVTYSHSRSNTSVVSPCSCP